MREKTTKIEMMKLSHSGVNKRRTQVIYSSDTTPNENKRIENIAMRFQDRDGEILNAISEYGGVLARRHIHSLFWFDKSVRAMDQRLSKLYHNGYISRPNKFQSRTRPIPEPIVWLDWKGALFVAGINSITVDPPTKNNENQMRLLQRHLREQGFPWLREPLWNQLLHDLTVIDFRLGAIQSIKETSDLSLEAWLNEGHFRANPDVISFRTKNKTGNIISRKKGVIPDGYFEIVDKKRKEEGQPYKARFLLELDLATHDNPSFGIEKVAAGKAYIQSTAYKSRFGVNSGRWLIVTTGDVRMKNLIQQTKKISGKSAHLFFFTTLEKVFSNNIFSSPIWVQVDSSEHPQPLLENSSKGKWQTPR